MEAPLAFTSKIELEDYLVFNALISKRQLPFMIGFMFVVTLIMSVMRAEKATVAVFFTVFVLLVVAYLIVRKRVGNWQAKKLFDSHAEISESRTYSFDEKGGSVESVSTSGTFLWEVVPKVEELNALLLIYRGGNMAHIIRKSDLSEAQLQGFRNLVASVPGLEFKRVEF